MNLLIVLAKIYHLVVCVSCVLYFRDISTDFHSKSTLKAPEKNPFNPSKNVLKKTQRLTDTAATDTNNDYSPFKKNQEKIQSKRQALVYVPFVENQAKYLENDLYKPEIFDAIHESAKKGLIKVLNNYPVEQTIMNEPREEYLHRMKEFSRKTKRSNSNQDSLNDTLLKLIGIASLYGSLAKRSPLTNRNHNISQSSLPNKLHPRSHTTNVSESEKIAPDMQTFMEILSRKKKAKQFLPVSKSQSSSFCKQNDSDTNDLEDEDTNSTITGTLDLLHMKIEVPKSAIDAKLLYLIKQFVEDPQVGSRVKISPEEIPQVHLKDVGSIPMEHLNELLQKLMTIKHVTKRSTDTRPIRMSLNDADVADLEKIVSFLNDIRFNKYGALFADDVPTSEVLLTVINKYKQQNEELREEIQNTHPIKVQKFFRMEAMTPGFREFSRHRTSTEPEPDDDIDDEQKQFSSGREYEERPKNSRVHKTHHPRPFGYFQNRYHSKTFAKTTPKSSQVSYENYEDEQEDELEPVEKESQGPSNNRLLRDFGESLHENLTANNKDNTPMPKTTSKSPDFEKLGWTDPAASKNQKTAPQGVDKLNPAEFLYRMNKKAEIMHHKESLAEWAYECDMSEKKNAALKKISLRLVKAERKISEKIRAYSQIYQGNNPLFLRQFKLWSILGESALPDDKYLKLQSIVANMTYIYSTATLCPYQSHSECTLKLEPDITNIMANGRDPHMLYYYWNAWREQTGRVMKPLFEEYVRLMNDVAHLNNFSDAAEYWLYPYEYPHIENLAEELWLQIKPLYDELHFYVRLKLRKVYGKKLVPKHGPIPAHLFGNMWAQSWSNLYDILVPYPNVIEPDLTKSLLQQNFTVLQMFKTAEQFFMSLGFEPLPKSFWTKSVLEASKKDHLKMVCHASAWDMYNRKDFRIKMCTSITKEDFIIIHHEMGHVYYFIEYKLQPFIFRDGANPGFHEAIGDTIALSVSTPKHLKKLQLIPKNDQLPENHLPDHKILHKKSINHLLEIALDKIAFIPFGYLIDKWRWDVFKRKVHPKDYNHHWWKLRLQYQNIAPPNRRTAEDFDPGSKFHVAASVPYFRYFISFITQFQFYKALCIEANQYHPETKKPPLHKCDFFENKNAGRLLQEGLRLGRSKPWPFVMHTLTGSKEISADAINEYFKPLKKWLRAYNRKHIKDKF